ncbi:MAG: TolC family protein [Flavobacteriaceae bacterium]
MKRMPQAAFAALAPLFLAGCITGEQVAKYAAPDAGFANVASSAAAALNKEVVWAQDARQAEAFAERVRALVHRKTIGAETAVQVALLNNRSLQAAYADVGLSAADVWQELLLENPKVSIGVLGIAAPEVGAWRAIEGMVANNILALLTRARRVDIAETNFRAAQARAVLETLRLAADTRRAWVETVAAFEASFLLSQAQQAADAASELAQKLGETGAMPKAAQAREHVFYAELAGQRAKARLAARLAKERLTRLMGLWGNDLEYFVPDQLPALTSRVVRAEGIEAEALRGRADLQLAKLQLEALAKSLGLTAATRYLTDLEIVAGVEVEREIETEYELNGGNLDDSKHRKTTVTPQVELEFVIPIFDSGKARMRKAELEYMKAANLLAERAVNIRSEARSAYLAYRSTHDIARHYVNAVLPLRAAIEQESLLTYNGMITNTFELLADLRAKTSGALLAADRASPWP